MLPADVPARPMTRFRFPLLAGFAAMSACNLDTTDRISQPPRVRIVNAAVSTTAVNVHLNENVTGVLATPLAYEGATEGCLLILAATHQLRFVQNGVTLASVTAPFAENPSYLATLVENAGTFKAVLASDTGVAPAGSYGLRLINATAAAGDVHATTPGEAPGASTLVAANLAPVATITNPALQYAFRPEAAARVRLFDTGTTATARSDLTLASTGARRLTTVIFTEPTFTGDPAALQLNACP